jgi:CheY-like chemotaxis protein
MDAVGAAAGGTGRGWASPAAEFGSPRPPEGAEVLVIEDDSDVREVIRLALEGDGFRVRTVPDGRAALTALAESRPDVILLDLWMPVMHGWAFRARQRRTPAWRDIPLVVLTATDNLAPTSSELAPDAVLAKPFTVGELLAVVHRLSQRG